MYLDHFKLKELPFRLSPDPQFLFLSKAHARAKAYMESTIWFTDGFVVITGEIGAGKTTLVETFLSELERDVVVAQVNQTQVSTLEFLQSVLVQFGFSPFKMKKAEALATLNQFLIDQYNQGRKVLLIVDEAQNLSLKVLEEVRMLSGVETTKEKVLRIILSGQPELNEKLDAPELVQMAQRVRLRFHLPTLSLEETQAYVLHRLEVAGSHGRVLFSPATYDLIQRYSGGTPRLINTLCDTAMLAAANEGHELVDLGDVYAALGELRWQEFSPRGVSYKGNGAAAPGAAQTHAQSKVQTGGSRRGSSVTAHPGASSDLNAAADGQHTGNTSELKNLAGHAPPEHGPTETQAVIYDGPPLARILLVSSHGSTSHDQPLFPGRLLIGRTPGNDLQIDSRFISRHHCQILTTQEGSVIEDLNSTNGIFFKSKRVRFHHLNDGDVILVGQHEILYMDERARARATAPPSTGENTGEHSSAAQVASESATE